MHIFPEAMRGTGDGLTMAPPTAKWGPADAPVLRKAHGSHVAGHIDGRRTVREPDVLCNPRTVTYCYELR